MEANDNHAEEHTVAEFIEFASMVAQISQAHGLPKVQESTLKVARRQVVSSWTNVSAHVLSKESFVTTRLVMVLLALSTRNLQRVASQLSVALVPSTRTTGQTSPNLRL